ncbi:MAG: cupin domain-containing protein [bacterium]
MFIKHLTAIPSILAGDNSLIREILNPLKEELNMRYSLAWAQIKPGEKTLPHRLKTSEVYYIIRGSGIMHINNEEKRVNKNDTIYIPPDTSQFIENIGEESLDFLCIVDPAWTPDAEEIL